MDKAYTDPSFFRRFRRYYTYIEPVVTDPVVRDYFSLVASLFLIAIFVFFAISPTITTIIGLTKKIDEQKKTIASMDKKISDLITAQQSLSAFEPSLPALYNALPTQPVPETILSVVHFAASSSAVTIKSLQFEDINLFTPASGSATGSTQKKTPDSKLGPGIKPVGFSLIANGAPGDIAPFLAKLEELSRVIKLTSISFGANKGTVTIGAQAFYLSDIVRN